MPLENRGENDEFYAFTCTYRIQPSGRIEQDQRVRCQSQGAWHEQRRDHRSRVMFGCIDFYKEARAQGIKPILGCEVYVAPGSRFDRETSRGEDRYYHLVLLAENNTGYSNLMKIVSAGFIDGFYYKPRVDMEILEKYHEALSRFPPALQVRWRVRWCGTSTRWEKRPHCGMRRFSEKAISSWNCRITASRSSGWSISS